MEAKDWAEDVAESVRKVGIGHNLKQGFGLWPREGKVAKLVRTKPKGFNSKLIYHKPLLRFVEGSCLEGETPIYLFISINFKVLKVWPKFL